jgi:genome maintenance exonuclease 1
MFGVIKKFLKDNLNNIHALENPLYSEVLRVAGRVDCIAEWNGKLSVIDFKTSSKEKKKSWIEHYFIQASTYAIMFYEMFGVRIDNLVILMVSNDGTVQVFEESLRTNYLKKMYNYVKKYYEDHECFIPSVKINEQKRNQ